MVNLPKKAYNSEVHRFLHFYCWPHWSVVDTGLAPVTLVSSPSGNLYQMGTLWPVTAIRSAMENSKFESQTNWLLKRGNCLRIDWGLLMKAFLRSPLAASWQSLNGRQIGKFMCLFVSLPICNVTILLWTNTTAIGAPRHSLLCNRMSHSVTPKLDLLPFTWIFTDNRSANQH